MQVDGMEYGKEDINFEFTMDERGAERRLVVCSEV